MSVPVPTPERPETHLSQIVTPHSLFRLALEGSLSARDALVLRYREAIRRLSGKLFPRDDDAADEVAQRVLVKLLQGKLAPGWARFRNFLSTVVRNEARTWWRQCYPTRQRTDVDFQSLPEDKALEPECDEALSAAMRRVILDRALADLKANPKNGPLLAILIEYPEEDSEQLAARLVATTGLPATSASVRQRIHRARLKLAKAIVHEVGETLQDPTPEQVADEVVALGLMNKYIQDVLGPMKGPH